MLTKRIIPCLDVKGGKVVKGVKFKNIKEINDPIKLAQYYDEQGADELVFYDITASHENREIMIDIVEEISEKIFIPFTVGGGIKSIEDFKRILRAGADKVSVNSQGVKNPNLIKKAAEKFGSQCVVLSIDTKKVKEGSWKVFINGGRKNTDIDLFEWAKKGTELGAGEIVINTIDTDGVKKGFDVDLVRELTEIVKVPVIASGGAGQIEDFYDVFDKGGADGAIAASVFHFREIMIEDLKRYLIDKGISIRRQI